MSKIAETEYLGGLRTSSVHLRSGKVVLTDAPVDNHGRGEAFSPTDLLSTSLACCMISIMGIVANRISVNIDGARADVVKVMGTDPRRVIEIGVAITIPGKDLPEKDRQMMENAAHTCPVAKSLHPDLKQTVSFEWV